MKLKVFLKKLKPKRQAVALVFSICVLVFLGATYVLSQNPGSDFDVCTAGVTGQCFDLGDLTPIFNWDYITSTVFGQGQYRIQIDNNSNFSSPTVDSGWIASSADSHEVSDGQLTAGTTYYWRIRAIDTNSSNTSGWAEADSSYTPLYGECRTWETCDRPCGGGQRVCDDPGSCKDNTADPDPCNTFLCPTFSLRAEPPTAMIQTVRGGGTTRSGTVKITVEPANTPPNTFDGPVDLSVEEITGPGDTNLINEAFSDTRLTSSEYSTGSDFYVTIPNDFTAGDYNIKIRGEGSYNFSGYDPVETITWVNVALRIEIKDPEIIEF